MTEDEVAVIALSFPGAETGTSYGRPSFKVNGKFLTRIRVEDASVVLMEVPFDEREMLIEAEPETFHFTDHYKDSPCVLARLASLQPEVLRGFLERRFRKAAKKSVVKAWEAARAASP